MKNTTIYEQQMEITKIKIPFNKGFNKVFDDFCIELGFRQERRDLLKALLKFSKGQIIFESCLRKLARSLFKEDRAKMKTLKNRVRERFETFEEWQGRNNVELIRVLKREPDGRDYGKYKPVIIRYEFTFFSEWLKTCFENPNESINTNLKKLFEKYKEEIATKGI